MLLQQKRSFHKMQAEDRENQTVQDELRRKTDEVKRKQEAGAKAAAAAAPARALNEDEGGLPLVLGPGV
jgi:hypothetical protein